jgi:hypothetical protein
MRLVWLATILILGAQQPPPPPAAQTFRSGTQIVEVDARVFGKDGRFVPDLGPADFEIAEDGVPQKIQSVILVRGTDAAPSAPSSPSAPAPLAPLAPSAPTPLT